MIGQLGEASYNFIMRVYMQIIITILFILTINLERKLMLNWESTLRGWSKNYEKTKKLVTFFSSSVEFNLRYFPLHFLPLFLHRISLVENNKVLNIK